MFNTWQSTLTSLGVNLQVKTPFEPFSRQAVQRGLLQYNTLAQLGPLSFPQEEEGGDVSTILQQAADQTQLAMVVFIQPSGSVMRVCQVIPRTDENVTILQFHVVMFVLSKLNDRVYELMWFYPLFTLEWSFMDRWWNNARKRVGMLLPPTPVDSEERSAFAEWWMTGWKQLFDDGKFTDAWREELRNYLIVHRIDEYQPVGAKRKWLEVTEVDDVVNAVRQTSPLNAQSIPTSQLRDYVLSRLDEPIRTFVDQHMNDIPRPRKRPLPDVIRAVKYIEPMEVTYHEWKWEHENAHRLVLMLRQETANEDYRKEEDKQFFVGLYHSYAKSTITQFKF